MSLRCRLSGAKPSSDDSVKIVQIHFLQPQLIHSFVWMIIIYCGIFRVSPAQTARSKQIIKAEKEVKCHQSLFGVQQKLLNQIHNWKKSYTEFTIIAFVNTCRMRTRNNDSRGWCRSVFAVITFSSTSFINQLNFSVNQKFTYFIFDILDDDHIKSWTVQQFFFPLTV